MGQVPFARWFGVIALYLLAAWVAAGAVYMTWRSAHPQTLIPIWITTLGFCAIMVILARGLRQRSRKRPPNSN
jgi:hypothetical protein